VGASAVAAAVGVDVGRVVDVVVIRVPVSCGHGPRVSGMQLPAHLQGWVCTDGGCITISTSALAKETYPSHLPTPFGWTISKTSRRATSLLVDFWQPSAPRVLGIMAPTELPATATTSNGLPDEVITCLQNARFVSLRPTVLSFRLFPLTLALLAIPCKTLA
jgi:hypothetical protein